MPENLVNPAAGEVVHYLGGVDGLDTVIEQAFLGLPSEQVAQLADKAEGAPRLLDEMLMYLGRRQKFFVGRDFNAALTEARVADVMAHDFTGFVADRLEQAPEHVRRALAIASTQGGPLLTANRYKSRRRTTNLRLGDRTARGGRSPQFRC